MFNTVNEIKQHLVRNGWSDDISLQEISLEEAKNKGYLFAIDDVSKGKKYFKMDISEDIYNDKGEVVLYAI